MLRRLNPWEWNEWIDPDLRRKEAQGYRLKGEQGKQGAGGEAVDKQVLKKNNNNNKKVLQHKFISLYTK